MKLIRKSTAIAHPSLALIKYWGKVDTEQNLPATPSLAVTLDSLTTTTTVHLLNSNRLPALNEPMGDGQAADQVYIDGQLQPHSRFAPFFQALRHLVAEKSSSALSHQLVFEAHSSSNFPASAGLASSASGFAALAVACADAADLKLSSSELSALARWGSASAARSLWGGFTVLKAGSTAAEPLYDESWWPEFRTVVLEVESGAKSVSSRQAMEATRQTSPYYTDWVHNAPELFLQATHALEKRNLDELGPLVRLSYMRMFASMFAADPPIVYWKPGSVAVIQLCERMRKDGISVWETMDAGPQVKLFCLEKTLPRVLQGIETKLPDIPYRVSSPGSAPKITSRAER